MANEVKSPFTVFHDDEGEPLENGKVYIGEYGKNPKTYPIEVFWDKALTTPATNPLYILEGYISRNGSPAKVFVKPSGYSIYVEDKKGRLVWSFLESGFDPSTTAVTIDNVTQIFGLEPEFDGQRFDLTSYYDGEHTGGIRLKYNPNRPKEDHNGINVFSVTMPYTTIDQYQTKVGETDPGGLGCLERLGVDYSLSQCGVRNDGTNIDGVMSRVCQTLSGYAIKVDPGLYNLTAYPAGINNVVLTGVGSTIEYTNLKLPVFSPTLNSAQDVAIVAGVIRYYGAGPQGAGWYFLVDQSEQHDPILLGPVSASGSMSLILDVNISDFGLDPNLWTPGGFVCGPDETLASQGVAFGASVGVTSITIQGSYNNPPSAYISYDGASWAVTGSTVSYSFSWVSGATAYLEVTRTNQAQEKSSGNYNGLKAPMITARVDSTGPWIDAKISNITTNGYRVTFWDSTLTNITTESTALRFYVQDPCAKNLTFNFGANPGDTANIWMFGAFVKK